jgi:tripartite-type tricarboxylate transporter receptor subunit TctC
MIKSLAVTLVLAAFTRSAAAQSYPARPVHLVVPFPAGGVTDVVARTVAGKLSSELGQPVVVENKAGASGILGTETAAKAPPDGYTLLLGNISTLGVNPATYAKLSYDPRVNFAPVSMLAVQPLVIAVHPSVPAKTLGELIALAKARPDTLSYGSAGSSIHLAVELFNRLTGIRMNHVPYKGSAPAINDLIGGHINVLFDPISTLYPQVRGGKARGLAVTTNSRSSAAPELPTAIESGVAGFDVSSWQALVVPKGTPQEVIGRLNAATTKVLGLPDVKEAFAKQGAQPSPSTPQQLEQHIGSEVARWRKVAQDLGLKPQ